MEALEDFVARREKPTGTSGMVTAAVGLFAVSMSVVLYERTAPKSPEPARTTFPVSFDLGSAAGIAPSAAERLRPDDLEPGRALDLVGSRLLIPGETRFVDGKEAPGEDIELDVRRRDGEMELVVNGKAYRIQDTMNVEVGKSIVSATLTDGVVTVVTTTHGTAKVDRPEIDRIVRQLAGAAHSPVPVSVSTNFAPEGALLSGSIAISRMYRGWKEGDKESYDIGFERVEPDQRLAMAPGR